MATLFSFAFFIIDSTISAPSSSNKEFPIFHCKHTHTNIVVLTVHFQCTRTQPDIYTP
eukprot:m.181090 g.181090  ORF g.181090 m.181090 type:complete len:58 (-) comp13582_c0_seq8:1916-2089(-)